MFVWSKKTKGATLIELVIYIAIATTILVTFTLFALNIIKTSGRSSAISEVEHNLQFSITKIRLDFESVNQVDINLSIFNNDNGKIVLGSAGDAISYQIADGVLQRTFNGTTVDITTSRVRVTKLRFENYSNTGDRQSIRVLIEIYFNNTTNQKQYDYIRTIEDEIIVSKSL